MLRGYGLFDFYHCFAKEIEERTSVPVSWTLCCLQYESCLADSKAQSVTDTCGSFLNSCVLLISTVNYGKYSLAELIMLSVKKLDISSLPKISSLFVS